MKQELKQVEQAVSSMAVLLNAVVKLEKAALKKLCASIDVKINVLNGFNQSIKLSGQQSIKTTEAAIAANCQDS